MKAGPPLVCPRCESGLAADAACAACGLVPVRRGGVLDFLDEGGLPVPEPQVNRFYEARPFPGYADGDDATTLLDRCRASPFLDALDAAVPPDASVLDAGCGTGQISNFLALAGPGRSVTGADACRASLAAADEFRGRAGVSNLRLVRGDLFRLPLPEEAFDVVNCRGVVHHTPDPRHAIRRVARHVRPGGHLVLGFYESIARLPHRVRRGLGKITGAPVVALDAVLRRRDLGDEKKMTWIEDQYRHPLEWSLAFPWVRQVVEAEGFEWVRSVPPAPESGSLFEEQPRPGVLSLLSRRWGWALLRDAQDAGLVCLVARRRSQLRS